MAISLKPGVSIAGVRPEMVLVIQIVASIYKKLGYLCVITSVTDGKHSRGSRHYVGLAADFRTRDMPKAIQNALYSRVVEALGTECDVVLEPTHLHVEYDPER